MHKIFAPHLNSHVIVGGRKRPVAVGPHFRFAAYATNQIAVPATSDYSPKALTCLRKIYRNDELGDCLPAAFNHVMGVETANADAPFLPTDADVTKDYEAIGGYIDGNPSTDNGCDEITGLNYYQQHGWRNGTKALGWISIDGTNKAHVQLAMYAFEHVVFATELPTPWISPFPSGDGFVWGAAGAPNPENGHAYMGVGHGPRGIAIDTWALLGLQTYEAIAAYNVPSAGGGVYALLTPDQLAKGMIKCPNGIAWADLISDFDALGGHVPLPSPSPTPSPPGSGMTLSQAIVFANAGINAGSALMTRAQARTAAARGLTQGWPKTP